jgi:hypothetical protein
MWWVVNATLRPLYPWKRLGTHCIGRLGMPQGWSEQVRKTHCIGRMGMSQGWSEQVRKPHCIGRLGMSQGWSEQVRKTSPPPEFDLRTVQLVASFCNDWAIPANPITSSTIKISTSNQRTLRSSLHCFPSLLVTVQGASQFRPCLFQAPHSWLSCSWQNVRAVPRQGFNRIGWVTCKYVYLYYTVCYMAKCFCFIKIHHQDVHKILENR